MAYCCAPRKRKVHRVPDRDEHAPGRRRARLALGTASTYAALVLAVAIFVLIASARTTGSLAGVWLIACTLPISIPLSALPLSGPGSAAVLTLGGFAQAALLWRLLRGNRTA